MAKYTYEQLVNEQKRIEQVANSQAAGKVRAQMENHVYSKSEYNLAYGKNAIAVMLPIVEEYVGNLITLRNQHLKKFYWDFVRPVHKEYLEQEEKRKKRELKKADVMKNPCETIADIVAVNLVGGLSKEMSLTNVAGKIAQSLLYALNVPLEMYEAYQESAMQFSGIIIVYISENTDIFSSTQVDGREYVLRVSDEWNKIIEETCQDFGTSVQSYCPMVIPPIPHTSLNDGKGGYLVSASPLRKKLHSEYNEYNAETNPEYFQVINAAQNVAYCVNTKLLEVLRANYYKGIHFKDYPIIVDEEVPIIAAEKELEDRNKKREKYALDRNLEYTPLSLKTERDILKAHVAKEVETVRKVKNLLEQADMYSRFEAIYYPIFVDHRSRRYPYSTAGLSYQGDEMSKALLHLANKRKVDAHGMIALLETLGNALGLDKKHVRVKSQIAANWWNDNKALFMSGDFSIFFTHEDEFDEAITALAIVLELIELEKDENYETGIICHRDARVSGSSIIGTILQDKTIMQMTSVIDTEEDDLPDAYVYVAREAAKVLSEMIDEGNTLAMDLAKHIDELFSRKAFKTAVMC